MARNDLIVGLDVGTTKICTVVGEATESGVDIIGIGTTPSTGLRRGIVVNIEKTVQCIKKSLEDAELMAREDHEVADKSAGEPSTGEHGFVDERHELGGRRGLIVGPEPAMITQAERRPATHMENNYV